MCPDDASKWVFFTRIPTVRHIDNASGHYLPTGTNAQHAAETAFQQIGFNTQGKYEHKEWRNGDWRPIE
mgnify:CR=1 FL=1